MKYFIIILLSFFFSEAFSQEKFASIEGTIRGLNGSAALYTTIKVKHGRNGTCAYLDGKFKLDGVKIGDTLLFTNVGYRQSYFVVEKKYNKLDFTLAIDTLNTVISKPFISIIFKFTNAYSDVNQFFPVKFSETSEPVLEGNKPDGERIFTKVEVEPYFYINNDVFVNSLDSIIIKLSKKLKPKRNATVSVFYFIRKDAKIEVTTVESPFAKEVNNIFISLFDKASNIFPAVQNGRNVAVFCVTKFEVEMNKDKSISVRILQ